MEQRKNRKSVVKKSSVAERIMTKASYVKNNSPPQKQLSIHPRLDRTVYGKRSSPPRNGPGFSGASLTTPCFPDCSLTLCLPLPPLSSNTGLHLTLSTWSFLRLPTPLWTSTRGCNVMTMTRNGQSDLTSSVKINRTIKFPSCSSAPKRKWTNPPVISYKASTWHEIKSWQKIGPFCFEIITVLGFYL